MTAIAPAMLVLARGHDIRTFPHTGRGGLRVAPARRLSHMGRVVHFEIHCADLDRAEHFYTDVFGWRIEHWEGAPVDYRLITTGTGPGIDGALTQRHGEIDGQAIIAYVNTIEVDDLDDTSRKVAAGGGEMTVEPATVPGVGAVAYFKDTEGNVFGALQPA
jgi:predicted enzyme related to lactoylglutathione lyase